MHELKIVLNTMSGMEYTYIVTDKDVGPEHLIVQLESYQRGEKETQCCEKSLLIDKKQFISETKEFLELIE